MHTYCIVKNIEVIKVCPSNIGKPLSMINKGVIVENECFFLASCSPHVRLCLPWTRLVFTLGLPWTRLVFALNSPCRSIFVTVDFSTDCEPNACRMRYVVIDCTLNGRWKHPDCVKILVGGGGWGTMKCDMCIFVRSVPRPEPTALAGREREANAWRNARFFYPNQNLIFFSSRLVFVSPIHVCVTGA